jgi:hypothetical protein
MTTTNKPVQRCTELSYSVLFPGRMRKSRAIVVRIEKGDLLRFREKGRRQWYDMPIERAASIAVQASAGFRVCMMPGPREKKGGAKRRR